MVNWNPQEWTSLKLWYDEYGDIETISTIPDLSKILLFNTCMNIKEGIEVYPLISLYGKFRSEFNFSVDPIFEYKPMKREDLLITTVDFRITNITSDDILIAKLSNE